MESIGLYQIVHKLYADFHLTVYQVKDPATEQLLILRILNPDIDHDRWYELYAQYEGQITNYKYLPRWLTVDNKDNKAFSVLSGTKGQLLQQNQLLAEDQVDQLIDAIGHLHRKKFVHGDLKRENIWIGEDGNIVLYGAGEKATLNPEVFPTMQDDLRELISLIEGNSSINTTGSAGKTFHTIGEVQDWLEIQKSDLDIEKEAEGKPESLKKPVLVEKGELIEKSEPNTEPKLERKQEKEKEIEKKSVIPAPEYVLPEGTEKKGSKRKPISNLTWLTGIVLVLSVILLAVWPGDANNVSNADSESENGAIEEPSGNGVEASEYTSLFAGWEIIKEEDLHFKESQFTVVAAAQKTDDISGAVKVAVLSQENGGWKQIWESEEYTSYYSDPESYINSFLTVLSDTQGAGLLVFDIPDGGSMGLSQVNAFRISEEGKGEEVWNGIAFGIEKDDQIVNIMNVGMTKLSLAAKELVVEEIPRSEIAPSDSIEVLFELNQENLVVPVDQKELSLKAGEKLAFIPANDGVKKLFDVGEISIYSDVNSQEAPFSLANSNQIMHGNFVKFESPGKYHIVLEYYKGPGIDVENGEYTFVVKVLDAAAAAMQSKAEEEANKIAEAEDELQQFFREYTTASVHALNTGDFTYAEDFLTFEGSRYKEQKNFIDVTFAKGITEEFLNTEVENVIAMADGRWQVTTIEDYIINGLEESKQQRFRTVSNVVLVENGWLMDELVSTDLVESEVINSYGDVITSAASEISNEDESYIEQFFYNYNNASVDAINYGNFSYVESYLTYDGLRYDEQMNFVNESFSKGITEEHLSTELEQVEILNDDMWRVTTIEKFIIHGTVNSKETTFKTITNVKINNGEWLIDELISTTEI